MSDHKHPYQVLFDGLKDLYENMRDLEIELSRTTDNLEKVSEALLELMENQRQEYEPYLDKTYQSHRDGARDLQKVFGDTPGVNQRRLEHFERRQHIQKIDNKPEIGDWVTT